MAVEEKTNDLKFRIWHKIKFKVKEYMKEYSINYDKYTLKSHGLRNRLQESQP